MAITNSHPPTEDPVALIKARIKEKRIFEARFLFRQFGDQISVDQKMKLADELAAKLSQAEQLLQRARAHAAGGERSQAEQVYREIEAIVIDMPGVAEESKALAGASALIAKIKATAPIAVDPEQQVPQEPEIPASEQESPASAVRVRRERRPRWPFWLAAGVVAVILSLLALWYDDVKNTSPAPAPSEQPIQKILIRPMVAEGSPTAEQAVPAPATPPVPEPQIEKRPESETVHQTLPQPTEMPAPKPLQATKAQTPPHPSLRLGTLQIEKSTKK